MTREEAPPQAQPWEHPARHAVEPRYERRHDDDRRYDRHGYAHKKRKGFDLFDIFD
jgi:Zn-finger nucleic acid-binding protein